MERLQGIVGIVVILGLAYLFSTKRSAIRFKTVAWGLGLQVAFSMLGPQKALLDPRSFTIATFALCGFANFGSIGTQIGGISALAPNKKDLVAKLGFRAMLAGTMANLISASIVGIMYHG